MAVRDDDRLDVLGALAQVGEVGQHEVDADHLGRREAQADVDDDDPAVVLDDGHVLADLAQAAERQDAQLAHACAPAPRRSPACASAVAASRPWRSSIARTAASSSLGGLDERQAQAAGVEAEQVQRRLRARRAGRHEQRLVDVAQRGVDLGAVLGLVDHPAHLVADDVAGDEDPAGAAEVERAREQAVVAGVEVEPVDRLQLVGVGLLDAVDVLDLGELGEQVGRHVRGRAAGDVVEQDRLVGGRGDRFVVARDAERGWAGCSTA